MTKTTNSVPSRPEGTAEYLLHRLRLAGSARDVFTSDAVALLHDVCAGRFPDIDPVPGPRSPAPASGYGGRHVLSS